jgi:hypothetical protein
MTAHTPTTVMTKADKMSLSEALDKIESASNIIGSLAVRYREKFDDLSEKAQEGERGASIDETAGDLETMTESLDEVYSYVEHLLG